MKYSSVTDIPTENASKYLKQLCKHFAHKIDVEYDDHKGHARFPMGQCNMSADDKILKIAIETDETTEALRTVEVIIEQHLVKFAWREEITFNWQQS